VPAGAGFGAERLYLAIARRLERELPDATLHVSDSSEHDVGHDRSNEIMSVLVRRHSPDWRGALGLAFA
jgi:hypothetical protein